MRGFYAKPVKAEALPARLVLGLMGLPAPLAGLIAESDVKASHGALFDEGTR